MTIIIPAVILVILSVTAVLSAVDVRKARRQGVFYSCSGAVSVVLDALVTSTWLLSMLSGISDRRHLGIRFLLQDFLIIDKWRSKKTCLAF